MQKRNPLLDFHPRVGSPETIWIVPIFYILLALVLGRVLPRIDLLVNNQQSYFSPATATSLLSTIASGMIAFTGFVFSMLFVMVQFGSSAYTPRIARYFLQDPALAHALGVFIATFIYSLIALSQVEFSQTGRVPDYTVATAMVFLLSSTLVFLLLIRRTTALQINNVLQMLGEASELVIQGLYPLLTDDKPSGSPERTTRQERSTAARLVIDPQALPPVIGNINHSGRPQRVVELNLRQLVSLTQTADVMVQVVPAVGDMVANNQTIFTVRGQNSRLPDDKPLRRTVKLGPQRTIEQDPKYALRLIVDIAIHALSPAINDPTTAVQALDQLDDLLRRIAIRDLDVGSVYDGHGVLRVIYPTPDWDDFLNLAINEIRYYGAGSIQVMRRLHALLADLRQFAPPERIPAIEHQLQRVESTITRAFPDPQDQIIAREPDRQGISNVR